MWNKRHWAVKIWMNFHFQWGNSSVLWKAGEINTQNQSWENPSPATRSVFWMQIFPLDIMGPPAASFLIQFLRFWGSNFLNKHVDDRSLMFFFVSKICLKYLWKCISICMKYGSRFDELAIALLGFEINLFLQDLPDYKACSL